MNRVVTIGVLVTGSFSRAASSEPPRRGRVALLRQGAEGAPVAARGEAMALERAPAAPVVSPVVWPLEAAAGSSLRCRSLAPPKKSLG